jgi:Flp pilus assembly pilin Flp
MKPGIGKLVQLIRSLTAREDGQDLVEYALVLALVGLGGFAGIEALARAILNLFIGIISVININLT